MRTKADDGGELERNMFDWEDTAFEEEVTYSTFGCNVFKADPRTPDRLEADVHIYREGAKKIDRIAPDGRKIRFWTFQDTDPAAPRAKLAHPAPIMRVRQGQIVHTHLTTSKGPHTIHHHGIEPTTANDGVGHVSFEVGDGYIYQWKPKDAGSFFYHCHRNTVLHFELGMWGSLIVDPPDLEDGKNYLYENGPTYDSEMIWVAHSVDPRWHEVEDHDAGLCGLDMGFNRYEPEYFLLSGVWGDHAQFDPKTSIKCQKGERVLIRLLNASYTRLQVKFGCPIEVVASDGHSWGRKPWCPTSVKMPANSTLELVTAQRYDVVVELNEPGDYPVIMQFRDWITNKIHAQGKGQIITKVTVR